MWAMIVKEFRQVRRDHRTLAMMIVMPVLLLVVFGYAASFDVSEIETVVYGPGAEQATEMLPDIFNVEETDVEAGVEEAEGRLRRGESVVALIADPGAPLVLIDGSQLFAARSATQAVAMAGASIPGLETEILFNPELETSAVLVPGLAGLILLFVGTVITSLGVVKERQAGTLEQLAVMPLRPADVFIGKIAPYFLVAAVDLVVVLVVGTFLFDVPFNGSVWIMALGSLLFLFVTLGLGVLISSVSQNQGQSIQLALMTLLPQVLLSGLIFPLASMAAGVRWIGYLLPLTYFNLVAQGVMLRGAHFTELLFPLGLLFALGVVIFGLAVLRFRSDLAAATPDTEPAGVAA
ncbi:MAG: ABC transporter permease [Actinobacteria bacterium]|nr:MAG: ABC transporter permease [Actinomycetota bacterium]